MNNLTTISWSTFFIIVGVLVIIWLISTKSRFGRTIIRRETPWDLHQWNMLLVILAITAFILVNPIFHLLSAGIVAALYYIFINRDALGRKVRYQARTNDVLNPNIEFNIKPEKTCNLICTPKEFASKLLELKSIERCIFSFPMLSHKPHPKIEYIKGIYYIKVELLSKDYLSSLISYIEKSGFEVEYKM